MKSRVPKTKKVTDIAKSGIILSIGMIVKNEEKHIGNCLKALKVLMDKIPCELIIADTGSTDNTFSICKEFTDKVFSFKWIDDFAAARNSTLEKARGMWYMFIDADEYLDKDVFDMVNFLTDPDNRYLAATYQVRNYNDTLLYYSDFPAVRIARNLPSLCFKGAIHECLNVPNEFYHLPTVAHHYGYVYETEVDKEAKFKRNRDLLLKELEEEPENCRILVHVADICEGDDRKHHLLKAIDVLKDENYTEISKEFEQNKEIYASLTENLMYRGRVYINLCRVVFGTYEHNYQKIVEYINDFFSIPLYRNCYAAIELFALLGEAYYRLNQFEDAAKAYEDYFDILDRYKLGKVNQFDSAVHAMVEITDNKICLNQQIYADILCKLGRFDETIQAIDRINFANIEKPTIKDYFNCIIVIIVNTKRYDYIVSLYKKCLGIIDDYFMDIYVNTICDFYMQNSSEREIMIEKISEKSDKNLPFTIVFELIKKDKNGSLTAENITEFFDNLKKFEPGITEAVYLAFKYKVYFPKILRKASYDQTQLLFSDLFKLHGTELVNIVREYCDYEHFSGNISEIFWASTIYYFCAKRVKNFPYEDKLDIYNKFVGFLADYVYNIYNPELLNDDDIGVLPPLYQFGYFMGKAKEAEVKGDKIGYIRSLKEGLASYEEMNDIVSTFIRDFK